MQKSIVVLVLRGIEYLKLYATWIVSSLENNNHKVKHVQITGGSSIEAQFLTIY